MDAVITRPILYDDNIVRQASKEKWDLAIDGVTVVIDDELFLPRPDYPLGSGPERYVSVDWLEYFDGTLRQRLNQVRDAVEARGRTVGRQARFAAVLVRSVHEAAQKGSKEVDVRTTGDVEDPSHSGIFGLEPDDNVIAQEIARRATAYPAYE